jgi:hypothetical protein
MIKKVKSQMDFCKIIDGYTNLLMLRKNIIKIGSFNISSVDNFW